MPIRAENKARYPKDWKAIVARIRERSGGRCECTGQCGRIHYIEGERQIDSTIELPTKLAIRCTAVDRKPHPATGSMVVLTTAHVDQQPENNDDDNLLHLCQACHNRMDIPHRQRGIRERKRIAKGDLFGGKE